ncbi:zinc transporter 10-like [Dromiciops gliroides]|uniref:zinc transporter 10-like n=1 Tax=Dromiciops gliroides TaxID=33562 RepID=UPI001CC4735F|nr:zinc transporter 10-like [Dromiciops gliroides]
MGRYSGKTCRLFFMLVPHHWFFFVAELLCLATWAIPSPWSPTLSNMLSDLISLCVDQRRIYRSPPPPEVPGPLTATGEPRWWGR